MPRSSAEDKCSFVDWTRMHVGVNLCTASRPGDANGADLVLENSWIAGMSSAQPVPKSGWFQLAPFAFQR